MDEILELWSLPWHALQRSLATKTSAEAHWSMIAGRTMRSAADAADSGVSWLVRAPARVQPSARRGP